MKISITNLQKNVPVRPPAIRRAVKRILRRKRILGGNISIVFVTDPAIQKLNKRFLKKKYATDVLAFDFISKKNKKGEISGEVIISADRALAQAKLYKTSVSYELMLYVVHGILHLLGYDDHKPKDILAMRREEKKLMDLIKAK